MHQQLDPVALQLESTESLRGASASYRRWAPACQVVGKLSFRHNLSAAATHQIAPCVTLWLDDLAVELASAQRHASGNCGGHGGMGSLVQSEHTG